MHRILPRAAFLTVVLLALAPAAALAVPSNDEWTGRKVIGSIPFTDTESDIAGATGLVTDPPVPCRTSNPVGASNTIWYSYTTGTGRTPSPRAPEWGAASDQHNPKGMRCRSRQSARPRSSRNTRKDAKRHRLPRGPGRDPHRADHQPHRPLQDPRQGQPFPPRPPEDGLAAPLAARLRQAQGRGPLPRPHRAPRHPPLRRSIARFRARLGAALHASRAAGMGPASRQTGRFEASASGQDRETLHPAGASRRLAPGGAGLRPAAGKEEIKNVRHSTRRADVGRPQARPRDRQGRPPGRRRRGRHLRRDLGARHRRRRRRSRSPASTSSRSP